MNSLFPLLLPSSSVVRRNHCVASGSPNCSVSVRNFLKDCLR